MLGDRLRREVGCQLPDQPGTGDVLGQVTEFDEVLVEQHVHHREQQRGVRAGARRDVAIGEFGGTGAGGVDDGEPAATLPQRPQLSREIGRGGQTSVGDKRIGADDHQMIGAVEIGHGERDRATEH